MNAAVPEDRDRSGRVVRRVVRNTFFLGLADVANKLIMFVFYIVAARHLGVGQFGAFSFALAFVTMMAVFTDLGLGAVATREIARDRSVARRLISNAVAIKLLFSLVTISLIVVLIGLMGYPRSTVSVVRICSLFVFGNAFTLYFAAVFQGFERMEFAAMSRVLQTLILIVGGVMLSYGPPIAERYALLYAGAGLASALLAWLLTSLGFVKPGFSVDFGEWRRMLRSALPVGISASFVMFYYWNGSTILSKLCGDAAVGIYSAPLRLVMGLGFASLAISGAVYPVMSRLFVIDSHRFTRSVELSLRYVLALVLPVVVLGGVLARPVTILLYGRAYLASVPVLRMLLFWVAAAGLNSLLSNYFFAISRPKVITLQSAAALVVNIAANLLLIPTWGAFGAATAIVLAEVGSLVFLFVQQLRTANAVRVTPLLAFAGRGAMALLPATAVAVVAARWHVLVGVVAGLALYVLALVAIGGIGREEWKLLGPLLRGVDA
jgi:O-antigen/teichoic acid export membrane protein